MSVNWQDYQHQAAAFFRKFDLKVSVDFELEGARAIHKVDVYVEGIFHGIAFKWIVECKAWNTSIPKEKVIALGWIVQDVGVDRGFLLSESGFQSGAVRAARKTNITLSSLDDLEASTEESFVDASIASLIWRIHKVRFKLAQIKKNLYHDEWWGDLLLHAGKLRILEASLEDAAKGEFPNVYSVSGGKRLTAKNLDDLLIAANEMVAATEKWDPKESYPRLPRR